MKQISGYCELMGLEVPENLRRPRGQRQYEDEPERPPLHEPELRIEIQQPDNDNEDEDENDVNNQ